MKKPKKPLKPLKASAKAPPKPLKGKISLYPLDLETALGAAVKTGPVPKSKIGKKSDDSS
jgi:hypothetical protein